MADTYRALVIHGVSDLRIDTVAAPARRPDQAEVIITHGGICGSDLHYLSHGAAGESVLRGPMVLGHEVVGRVGTAAADGSGPGVGTPVAIFPATPCGHCAQCLAGHGNVCPTTTYLGRRPAIHIPTAPSPSATRSAPTDCCRCRPTSTWPRRR